MSLSLGHSAETIKSVARTLRHVDELLFQLFHLVYVAALYVLPRKMPEFRWALDIISLCIYRSSFLF